MKGNNWWEFYLVRYLIGTVIGTLIVIALIFSPGSGINALFNISSANTLALSNIQTSHIILLGLSGFAYCYLASAPVLVFHATRSLFDRPFTRIILYIVYAMLAVFAVHRTFLPIKMNSFWVLFAIVLVQITCIVALIATKSLVSFYKRLTYARAIRCETEKTFQTHVTNEYVESYKHLREHGNAFLILVFEMLLGLILYNVATLPELVGTLLLWIVPGSFVWFLGTFLEAGIGEIF